MKTLDIIILTVITLLVSTMVALTLLQTTNQNAPIRSKNLEYPSISFEDRDAVTNVVTNKTKVPNEPNDQMNESRRAIDLSLNTTSYTLITRGILLESNKTEYNRNGTLEFELINISGRNVTFGLPFSLERWVNSSWVEVDPLAPNEAWAAVEIGMMPVADPWRDGYRQSLELNRFGSGLYRVSKVVEIEGFGVNWGTKGVVVVPSFMFLIK